MEHLVCGTQPVLAVRLQQVNEVVALIQQMIMKVEQQSSPLSNWSSGPSSLGSVRELGAHFDIRGCGGRQLAHHLTGDR